MSAANAAARKRRAAPDAAPSMISRPTQFGAQNNSQPPVAPNAGLTLPQVIALIDTRLVKLETFMKDSTQNTGSTNESNINRPVNRELEITNNDIVFQEVDRRFEILATEINNLKDMLLKLQTYTMEVNKTLMDERIHVFSDLGAGNTEYQNQSSDNIFLPNEPEAEQELASMDLRNLANEELSTD
jgi:hypothetical protein